MSVAEWSHDKIRYWPQAGIALGVLLNMVGVARDSPVLIGSASNMLVICGLFLGQRHRNTTKGDD